MRSVSSNPSLWKSALIYLRIFLLYFKCCIYVYRALVYYHCVSNILKHMKTVNKMWWQKLLLWNYVYQENVILHVKGKIKDVRCCYLTFCFSFSFSSFFNVLLMFSATLPLTKKNKILGKSHSNMILIRD